MIGAGIAGLCLARELALLGHEVTLLDDNTNSSASRTAAGLLQVAGGRLSRGHLRLRQDCRDFYAEFLSTLPGAPELRQQPHLKIAPTPSYRASFVSTLRGLGIAATQVPERQAVALPDASIDPDALLEALGDHCRELGVARASGRLVAWTRGVGTDATGKAWDSEVTVLCCGAGLPLLHQPEWSYQLEEGWGASYQGELRLDVSLEAEGQTLVSHSASRWKVGGSEAWGKEPPIRLHVPWTGQEVARLHAVRCKAPDGLPVVGQLEERLYVLGGLGRNGLLTAPLLARALAALIAGTGAPEWLALLSPERERIGEKRSWSK